HIAVSRIRQVLYRVAVRTVKPLRALVDERNAYRESASALSEERNQLQKQLTEGQQLVSLLTEERNQLQQQLTGRKQLASDLIRVLRLQRPFHSDGGVAYSATLNELPATDALVLLLEDNKALGPGGSEHQVIRDHGAGRFTLWNGALFFSASDSTDCN